ncbi:oligopeptide transport system substrate-binding protein [Haloactinopolyspora alba]|uniref:Oligopeptide transport system substrate-binding protein n=1 Tax=Haloactinopolyspora alba TaxID=648780 RepID=A0A2P8DX78_9ACTN|nr:ABC transporter substrate-binding protein [Haloactinopolyspora alba]PSL01828.1 oligopeptide transport system substrate-binding protein [Haloactinopolyspora alba]
MRVSARKSAVAGAAAMALALSACGGDDSGDGGGGSAEGGGGHVTVRGCNPQNPLVPGNTGETCGGDVVQQLFSKLVRYDPETAQPHNDIAESIESEDNRVWTITIKDGWTFHDGTPITAQSFVDAWNYTAHGSNAQYNQYFFEPFKGYDAVAGEFDEEGAYIEGSAKAEKMSGLKVIDEHTFEVTLKEPRGSFPLMVGYSAFAPLPEVFFEDPEAFGDAPVGSGPFKFDSWEKNRSIKISKYDDYAGEMEPEIESATFEIYEDDNAAYNDLQANQLDLMPQLPTSALAGEAYKNDLGERFVEREVGTIQTVTFAPESVSPELANPKLRQAISMAIDRESIIESIFAGTKTPATGWVAPTVDGYKPGACGGFCQYDPQKAKDLLAEAGGYDGTLTLSYNADADHQGWVDATCNSIRNTLDIKCNGAPEVDFATFRTKIGNREMPGMFRTGWRMDYPSAENFLVPLYKTGASSNDGDYSNPEFDRLVDEAATKTGEEAAELYNQAEALLAEEMTAIPMWYYKVVAGYSTNVDNVHITPFGTVDLTSVTTTS